MSKCWFSVTALRQLMQNDPVEFYFFKVYFLPLGSEDDLFITQDKTQMSACYTFLNCWKRLKFSKTSDMYPCSCEMISMSITNSEIGHSVLYEELLMSRI